MWVQKFVAELTRVTGAKQMPLSELNWRKKGRRKTHGYSQSMTAP